MQMLQITQSQIKQVLRYEPDTGNFFRLFKKFERPCSSQDKNGYIRIDIDGRNCSAHRLAWIYVYGEISDLCIDHINRIKSDNRISNLRLVTRSENQQNKTVEKNTVSGVKGVCWSKSDSKWMAQIAHQGKHIHLGRFKSASEAEVAYSRAASELHKFNPSAVPR